MDIRERDEAHDASMFLDSCSLKVCFACLLVPFDDMHDTDDSLCKHSAVCCGSNVKHTHCYLFCLLYPLVRQSPQRSHASERHAVRRGIPSRAVCASLAKASSCMLHKVLKRVCRHLDLLICILQAAPTACPCPCGLRSGIGQQHDRGTGRTERKP